MWRSKSAKSIVMVCIVARRCGLRQAQRIICESLCAPARLGSIHWLEVTSAFLGASCGIVESEKGGGPQVESPPFCRADRLSRMSVLRSRAPDCPVTHGDRD